MHSGTLLDDNRNVPICRFPGRTFKAHSRRTVPRKVGLLVAISVITL